MGVSKVLRVQVPAQCVFCSAATVAAETTITGSVVLLSWCCRTCHRDWPMTVEDREPERRSDQYDRRVKTRNDRRGTLTKISDKAADVRRRA